VLICDDHELFAESLAIILAAWGYEGATFVTCPDDAAAVVPSPDVCLMDLRYGAKDRFDAIRNMVESHPTSRVIVLSGSSDLDDAARAQAAGAHGFIVKGEDIRQVVEVIERVLAGERVLATGASRVTRAQTRSPEQQLATFLTVREREVLEQLAQGRSTAAIAQEMGVSYATVRTHIQNMLAKLGVHSQLEAVAFAAAHGLIDDSRSAPVVA
jgi:DNA-binding NarL/FixJ family response regulator